jgi:parallel beta-helix repeat protein
MKKTLLYTLLVIGSPLFADQTYYIDSQLGKDSWSGHFADPIPVGCSTSTCTDGPWRTMYKIYKSSLTLAGGDSVLLRRGRVWNETIWQYASGTPGKPLQFGAYGVGNKPALYPPSPISGSAWSFVSGSIWRAPLASPPVSDILVGDVPQTWAREPNSGFFTIKSTGPSASQFVDPDLAFPETEIIGSTIKLQNVAWTLQTHRVTAYDPAAHRVTLDSVPTPYAMKPGSGYVMMGKRHLIDQPGEWAWESGYLYVWPHDGNSPTFGGRSVGVPSDYGIVLSRVHDVAVRDIEVRGSSVSVAVAYSTAIVLSGLDLYGSANFGVNLYKVNDAMVEKCALSHTLRDGITVAHSTHVAIVNNTIEDTGLDLRQTTLAGIQAGVSTDILIAQNIVRRSGYAGITTTADDTRVINNIVESSCLVLDDCAAIYTHNKNKNLRLKGIDIIGNIVDGTANPYSSGIYLDDDSEFVRVKNNTVMNSSNWGIYLHNGHDNELSNNTIFNSKNDGIHIVSDNALKETRDNPVVDNVVFVSSTASSNVERITTTTDTNFGISDRNLFGTLFSTRVVTQITTAWGAGHNPKTYSLSSWRDATGLDLNSKETGEFYSFAVQIASATDRIANGSFNTSMSGWGHWSAAGTQTVGLKSAGDCAHDGGCLSVAFSSNPTAVLTLSHRIRIVKGVEYRVKGDLKSTLAGTISAVIRDQGVLNDILRQPVALPVGAWGNFDFTFIADRTDPGALFYLESKGNTSNYLVDNVSVRALTPISNNGADAALILVNKEPNARLVVVSTDTVSPYQYSWPITGANNGAHAWKATAFDAMGNSSTTVAVPVTVNIDITPPAVALTTPTAGPPTPHRNRCRSKPRPPTRWG